MIQLLKTLIPGFSDVSPTIWIIFAAVCLVYYVLYVIGFWRMFTKAGEAGWKSLIPVYNRYILFKTCWSRQAFINVLVYGVIGATADFYLYQGAEGWLVVALTISSMCCMIYRLLVNIRLSWKVSSAYGHGVPFAIGLFFLEPLFITILGLGRSQYVTPVAEPEIPTLNE